MARATIVSEYSRFFPIGPGDEAYVAEIKLDIYDMDADTSKILYIYAEETTMGDGKYYMLSEDSKMERLEQDEEDGDYDGNFNVIEEYYSIGKTRQSKYAKVFKIADRMLKEIQDVYGTETE